MTRRAWLGWALAVAVTSSTATASAGAPSDDAVADRVRERLFAERAVRRARDIRVTVKDGEVTLSGPVQSEDEAAAAIAAALTTRGVAGVTSKLTWSPRTSAVGVR